MNKLLKVALFAFVLFSALFSTVTPALADGPRVNSHLPKVKPPQSCKKHHTCAGMLRRIAEGKDIVDEPTACLKVGANMPMSSYYTDPAPDGSDDPAVYNAYVTQHYADYLEDLSWWGNQFPSYCAPVPEPMPALLPVMP